MTQPRTSEADFITMFEAIGAEAMAVELKTDSRAIYRRRRTIENKIGRILIPPRERQRGLAIEHPGKLDFEVKTGVVLVGSDAHYWPGRPSTAHRAFVKMCKEMAPKIVVMNGDLLDGATISRHPPIRWGNLPGVDQELEVLHERLDEITVAAGKAKRVWTLGNHDARFETKLATVAPEYAKVPGVHLNDHFPDYQSCWMAWVNDNTVIKHRFKGGIHATHNNTVWAGKTIVTGHLHSQKATPFTDYNGDRWGVDSGMLGEPYHPAFDYAELNPVNWRSGYCLLTYENYELLQPSLIRVVRPGLIDFHGKLIKV